MPLRARIKELNERAEAIEAGDKVCNHHWSGDPAYEAYCPGCDKHIGEYHSVDDIPLESYGRCHDCSMTDEQREKQKVDRDNAERDSELEVLSELKAKYPDHK